MRKLNEFLTEKKSNINLVDYQIYNPTYGSTIDEISKTIKETGLFYDEDSFFTSFGDAFFKPKSGKTYKQSFPVFSDKNNTRQVGIVNVSIFNRGTTGNTFELNMYIS